jgi:hypothetical protein
LNSVEDASERIHSVLEVGVVIKQGGGGVLREFGTILIYIYIVGWKVAGNWCGSAVDTPSDNLPHIIR